MTAQHVQRTPAQQREASAFRELARQLSGALKEGRETQTLERAQTIKTLADYSPLNQLLILKQHPAVTEVHGYVQWRELGYFVRPGEHGIRIIVPLAGSVEDGQAPTRFRIRFLFDRSQVEPLAQQEQQR